MGAKRAHVLQGLNAFGHMGDQNGHPWRQMRRIAGVPPSRLLHQVRSTREWLRKSPAPDRLGAANRWPRPNPVKKFIFL